MSKSLLNYPNVTFRKKKDRKIICEKRRDFDLENGILRGERTFIHEMLCNIHKRFVVSSLKKKSLFFGGWKASF